MPPENRTGPSRDAGVTAVCGVCGRPTPPGRVRRWCSPACRQAAYRRRTLPPQPTLAADLPPARSHRETTVYVCPGCDTRYLGQQRCEDCNLFTRRVGPGGPCPHCDEPVALTDLQEPLLS